MTDTHAHLNFNTYKETSEKIIKKCIDRNIRIINVGSQYDTSARAVKIAENYEGVYAAIGIHPIHLSRTEVDEEEMHFKSREEKFDKKKYEKLLCAGTHCNAPKKVVAIGEIGLDYFHIPDNMDFEEVKKIQKKGFIDQLEFAKEVNLPVILHCRGAKDKPYEAYTDMLEILRSVSPHSQEPALSLPKGGERGCLRGVIHCFGANLEIVRNFIELGFYIGFTGIITFKNVSPELLEVVKNIPLECILV